MKVFKFGGASVKDAESVRNIPVILENYKTDKLLIIISAMGKTTNGLEELCRAAFDKDPSANHRYEEIRSYHYKIADELFPDKKKEVFTHLNELFREIEEIIHSAGISDYDKFYDQIVSYGELLSTRIISEHLNDAGLKNIWLDARELIATNKTYRAAKIDWEATQQKISERAKPELEQGNIVISQGFIGSDGTYTTSLGREGSDFSAAIFAHTLDAEEVVVWKDVPGYMNADPKYVDDTVKLDKISYMESIELAFYGAKIIHPKTIRPLKNKGIPLIVKSFLSPDEPGSVIGEDLSSDALTPSCIFKEDQVLISISSRDFSFIAEDHLHNIFGLFSKHRISINLMQNSAISFSVCVDNSSRLKGLINDLHKDFHVKYNENLQLITIRYYNQPTIDKLTGNKEILLEQKSRMTLQMIVK